MTTGSVVDVIVEQHVHTTRLFFYPLVILASCVWIYHRWQQQSRIYRLGNVLPGPAAVPLFGNALIALFKKPEQVISIGLDYCSQYGYVVRGWLGSKLVIFLANPEDVEVILSSNVHIDKASDYSFFEPWLGEGLLISSGQKWRSHRKMIAPTFHINILKSFVDVFNQNSKNVVEKMRPEIGKTFDVHDHMSEVTVDILLETAMGITRKTQDKSGYDYAMAVMKMCDIIHQRHFKFWLRPDFCFKLHPLFKTQQKLLDIIHGLTNKVIKIKKQIYHENKAKGIIPPSIKELTEGKSVKTKNVLANGGKTLSDTVFKGYRDDLDFNDENDVGEKKRLAFLDLMLESAESGINQITDHEIKEEVDTIMFEGHDTTAAGSSFVLCLLGLYQDVQARVYDELYEIFGDSDRPATFSDTLQMKYLERVILETLRMYPPVPIIARELKKDAKIATNGYTLPAGATVVVCTYGVHRHPKHYKDPDTFNPDNFLPENMQNRHYYSYIPFSAGPRSCVEELLGCEGEIGSCSIYTQLDPVKLDTKPNIVRKKAKHMSLSSGGNPQGRKYALLKLKILLSTILRNYKSVSEVPEKDFKLTIDIILKRSDGFRLKFEPRVRVPSNAA